ncbi:MAG: HEPN domain-containing protein [Anaerolineae bacterium]|nr:HEPN domain-containing protein [Anaerolineae bacterium]
MADKSDVIHRWIDQSEESLAAAKLLLDAGYLNDATSRAYYSIFQAAKAALLSINIETRSHTGVFNQLGKHLVQTGYLDKNLSRILASAYQLRQESDYKIHLLKINHVDVETVIVDAEKFVAEIKNFLSKSNDS